MANIIILTIIACLYSTKVYAASNILYEVVEINGLDPKLVDAITSFPRTIEQQLLLEQMHDIIIAALARQKIRVLAIDSDQHDNNNEKRQADDSTTIIDSKTTSTSTATVSSVNVEDVYLPIVVECGEYDLVTCSHIIELIVGNLKDTMKLLMGSQTEFPIFKNTAPSAPGCASGN